MNDHFIIPFLVYEKNKGVFPPQQSDIILLFKKQTSWIFALLNEVKNIEKTKS